MTVGGYRQAGGTANDVVAMQLAATKRRRVWKIVIIANAVALVASLVGCLFMMKTQGLHSDIAKMRDEVGETLTMMSLGGANEAVSKYLPRLIDVTARWDRKFALKSEAFRGMDAELNQAQAMHRLGATAENWRRDLEGSSPMLRNELWQNTIKAQVENEQKKWPNLTHKKGMSEWMRDIGMEFWFGVRHGFEWPCGMYERTVELATKDDPGINNLGFGDRLHYILFPYYNLSAFTMLRLGGIALVTSGVGYLLCWIGLKWRFGWLSYVGLLYFLYLMNVAVFIAWLEVTR